MKFSSKVAMAAAGVALSFGVAVNAQDMSEAEQTSYLIGTDIGKNLAGLDIEFDQDTLVRGIRDALDGDDLAMTEEELTAVREKLMAQQRARQMKQMEAQQEEQSMKAEENQAKGEAFLAENKDKDGVKVTESGLQYEVLEAGDGATPETTDRVTVHYEGTLIDGTVFDSSYQRGEPATFALNAVIPGWTEGVALMPVGSTYKFYIPSDLAYGANGAGNLIGPNETLIFKVELLDIEE